MIRKESLMDKHKILDKRKIRLENILKEDYIPFLSGRPKRITVINKDDIMNLKINLNTIKTFNEFLEKV